jgi:aminopeptidase N
VRVRHGFDRILALTALAAVTCFAQARRPDARVDVEKYTIEAEVNPETQTLRAKVKVDFTPQDDAFDLIFGLNNALELHSVRTGSGEPVTAQRVSQDMTVRVVPPEAFAKGKPASLTFDYAGRLTGEEESPVWGIKFAAIHPDYAYFMYPSRWFPVYDYTVDRFAMDLTVKVPQGYRVAASGLETTRDDPSGLFVEHYEFTQSSFPGSFAVLKGDPVRISASGLAAAVYFRSQGNPAQQYASEFGRALEFFSGVYGLAPSRNLAIVETEAGSPNGYAGPGIVFLSPATVTASAANRRVVANQMARQWWGMFVSPASRNHLWLQNGFARYSELLYAEEIEGRSGLNNLLRDTYVDALTVDQPPVLQAARLEDYSPEYWAVTAAKGAATLHMLRNVMGDETFKALLKAIPERFAWRAITTDQFKAAAEEISGENLTGFFLQWLESSGAPEFNLEYTVFRTGDGFRINGKITQDLDLFRMPVKLRIETEGNPEEKTVIVAGTSSEFVVETFGKPKDVILDPGGEVLRYNDDMRVKVAIRRGEQFVEISEFLEAIKEYEKALQVKRNSSLAQFRLGEVYFLQNNLQPAVNAFREALAGDLDPMWVEVWSYIYIGKVFDITGDHERAVNEYRKAVRTRDNTQGALEEAEKYIQTPYQRERRP